MFVIVNSRITPRGCLAGTAIESAQGNDGFCRVHNRYPTLHDSGNPQIIGHFIAHDIDHIFGGGIHNDYIFAVGPTRSARFQTSVSDFYPVRDVGFIGVAGRRVKGRAAPRVEGYAAFPGHIVALDAAAPQGAPCGHPRNLTGVGVVNGPAAGPHRIVIGRVRVIIFHTPQRNHRCILIHDGQYHLALRGESVIIRNGDGDHLFGRKGFQGNFGARLTGLTDSQVFHDIGATNGTGIHAGIPGIHIAGKIGHGKRVPVGNRILFHFKGSVQGALKYFRRRQVLYNNPERYSNDTIGIIRILYHIDHVVRAALRTILKGNQVEPTLFFACRHGFNLILTVLANPPDFGCGKCLRQVAIPVDGGRPAARRLHIRRQAGALHNPGTPGIRLFILVLLDSIGRCRLRILLCHKGVRHTRGNIPFHTHYLRHEAGEKHPAGQHRQAESYGFRQTCHKSHPYVSNTCIVFTAWPVLSVSTHTRHPAWSSRACPG
ncbi:MAG: hypothetical protein BWX80_03013 [Candidatus Hydrogenedentes bacterium ADurb.Bin101]|nr:MAG: hypothetical protein BWX80_03013 [Candidatus Hydrogenedentes bacterium ADurb.Bin101]